MTLIYPLFAMFLLNAFVLGYMFRTRVRALRGGAVRLSYFRTMSGGGGENLPEDAQKAARHFSNLFEAPVLFYVVCLAAMIVRYDSRAFLVLAWIYFVARVAQAFIHLGPNDVMHRMRAYFFGWLTLATMWVMLALHAATTAAS